MKGNWITNDVYFEIKKIRKIYALMAIYMKRIKQNTDYFQKNLKNFNHSGTSVINHDASSASLHHQPNLDIEIPNSTSKLHFKQFVPTSEINSSDMSNYFKRMPNDYEMPAKADSVPLSQDVSKSMEMPTYLTFKDVMAELNKKKRDGYLNTNERGVCEEVNGTIDRRLCDDQKCGGNKRVFDYQNCSGDKRITEDQKCSGDRRKGIKKGFFN